MTIDPKSVRGEVVAAGFSPSAPEALGSRGIIGVVDEDGMILWAELEGNATPEALHALDRAIAKLGCRERMTISIDSGHALAGEAMTREADNTVTLVRRQTAAARGYFENTAIVPPQIWMPLQAQRVRYFDKHK